MTSMSIWHQRFLSLAEHVAQWSKDPSTKVGAVIVRPDKTIVSLGFNGFPRGLRDDGRLEDRETKYSMILHAEENAILMARQSLVGCTIYTWPLPPCSKCAAIIIQSGISHVVAPHLVEDRWAESIERATRMFVEAGLTVMAVVDNKPVTQ